MKLLRTLLVIGFAGLAQVCLASPTPFSGELKATDPVFNRPLSGAPPGSLSAVGTAVFYDVFGFTVTANGTYVMETLTASLSPAPADDTFIVLYQDAFNPASPLTHAVEANDDGHATGFLSRISRPLAAGVDYFLVVTTFANGATGAYTGRFDSVTGAGQVVLGRAVPEPGSLALLGLGLGLGLAGLGSTRKRRQP